MRYWLACATIGMILASGPAVATPEHEGSREMAVLLDRIARSADPVVNVYMNRARAAGISTLLQRKLPPAQGMQLRVRIATELLQGGQTQEAIEQLEHVQTEIKRQRVPVDESYHRRLRDLLGIAYLRVGGAEDGHHRIHGCSPWAHPKRRIFRRVQRRQSTTMLPISKVSQKIW